MLGRKQIGLVGVLVMGMPTPPAHADEPSVSSGAGATPAAASTTRSALLPPAPQLRLTWPVAPLAFSFQAWEHGNYAAGPLRQFRAEATWLRQGPLSLLSISRAERAFELDCRATCQPMLERAVAVEARLHLYSGAVVREMHGFARYEVNWSEASDNKKRAGMRFGLAGSFD